MEAYSPSLHTLPVAVGGLVGHIFPPGDGRFVGGCTGFVRLDKAERVYVGGLAGHVFHPGLRRFVGGCVGFAGLPHTTPSLPAAYTIEPTAGPTPGGAKRHWKAPLPESAVSAGAPPGVPAEARLRPESTQGHTPVGDELAEQHARRAQRKSRSGARDPRASTHRTRVLARKTCPRQRAGSTTERPARIPGVDGGSTIRSDEQHDQWTGHADGRLRDSAQLTHSVLLPPR